MGNTAGQASIAPTQERRQIRVDEDVQIEYPSRGATYCRDEFGVYAYGVYPRSSVLAGQTRRRFLGSFDTEADARTLYPEAEVVVGSGYAPPSLDHLPEDDS